MNFTSKDAGSSPTYYLLFSSVFFLLLFTTLSYKTPIMYFEGRWKSDFKVSILVTTVLNSTGSLCADQSTYFHEKRERKDIGNTQAKPH